MTWLDKAITWIAPGWGQSRARARAMARHFEAASIGRRTDNYSRRGTDANAAASGATLARLRGSGRDLTRNNPWAKHGIRRLCGNTVGWGIQPRPTGRGGDRIAALWKAWAESTLCDSRGQLTFYAMQHLAMRCIVESGEVLIRRRFRRLEDGLPIPLQLQILEPDYIDSGKDAIPGEAGGEIIQGIEYDAIGRRVAYWLFDKHPGGVSMQLSPISRRIPADSIAHIFEIERPGQDRGTSWFAPVDVRLHDFHTFEDATILKQQMAACLAVFTTDLDGGNTAFGKPGTDTASGAPSDTFEPGMIVKLDPGKQVTVANPPAATDHESFSAASLRGVAAGMGTTYSGMTGDYSKANYSSERAARLDHQSDVEHWRWHMLIPQLCDRVWSWALDAMILAGEDVDKAPAEWSPAPMPILDPRLEIQAYEDAVRNGFRTWAQVVRELGYDPREQLAEIRKFNAAFDAAEIILDCDPRRTNAAGQQQQQTSAGESTPAASDAGDGQDGEQGSATTH